MNSCTPPPLPSAPPPSATGCGKGPAVLGLLIALALLGGAVVLFRFDPAQHGFYPRCQLHRLTGLQCPGCGGLRALHALLHGHVMEAVRLNPLFVLALPVIGVWMATWLTRRRRNPATRLTLPTAWIWAGLAVVIAFGVLRNLPVVTGALIEKCR